MTRVHVQGRTVEEALNNLQARFPTLTPVLCDERGELRPRVNIYVNDEHVRYSQGLQTPLDDGDLVYIVPTIMGG